MCKKNDGKPEKSEIMSDSSADFILRMYFKEAGDRPFRLVVENLKRRTVLFYAYEVAKRENNIPESMASDSIEEYEGVERDARIKCSEFGLANPSIKELTACYYKMQVHLLLNFVSMDDEYYLDMAEKYIGQRTTDEILAFVGLTESEKKRGE